MGNTTHVLRPIEGALQFQDKMNAAYIRELFPDTHIMSGQQFMPFKAKIRDEADKIMNALGVMIFPVL